MTAKTSMKIERFEDIESWKEARNLVREVYRLFAGNRDYGFRDQIQRGAISVMSNIAEGFDRGSNKEFLQFLVIARGSLSEVRSLAYAAMDLQYLAKSDFDRLRESCEKLSSLLNGFMRYLKTSSRTK